MGEMVSLHHKQYKMFEIIKRFTESDFPSDENGLGFDLSSTFCELILSFWWAFWDC